MVDPVTHRRPWPLLASVGALAACLTLVLAVVLATDDDRDTESADDSVSPTTTEPETTPDASSTTTPQPKHQGTQPGTRDRPTAGTLNQCSATGSDRLEPEDGLPPAVEATRRRLVAAALTCDFGAFDDLFVESLEVGTATAFFDMEPWPGLGWREREEAGEPVLRRLLDALAGSYVCGVPVDRTTLDQALAPSDQWCVWAIAPATTPDRVWLAVINGDGYWVGFADDQAHAQRIMDLAALAIDTTSPRVTTGPPAGPLTTWPETWPRPSTTPS